MNLSKSRVWNSKFNLQCDNRFTVKAGFFLALSDAQIFVEGEVLNTSMDHLETELAH